MTAKQYREAIAKLELTQEAAGEFFGASARTGQRWAAGDYPIPASVSHCLKLMLDHKVKPSDLDKRFA